MNKLIIDKATDKEKRIIREKMSCLLDELDEKDKKKIYFDNDDINIVRDIASDFFLVRVCGGFQMDMRDGITKFICYIMISEPTSKVCFGGLKDLILGTVKGMGLKGSIQFFKDESLWNIPRKQAERSPSRLRSICVSPSRCTRCSLHCINRWHLKNEKI